MYSSSGSSSPAEASANAPVQTDRRNEAFIPAGAILSGVILAGFDAPTGRGVTGTVEGRRSGSTITLRLRIGADGRIARGDGSIPDIVWEDGVFVCTDWRTQQALEPSQQATTTDWRRWRRPCR